MHYRLTLADAIDAHQKALSYGGRSGINSLDMIQSALGRPYSGYHRTIARKAAALLHSMVGNHGFVDANKRTAWILVGILLERSGYQLALRDDERIDDLVVAVASGQLDYEGLLVWFRSRITR